MASISTEEKRSRKTRSLYTKAEDHMIIDYISKNNLFDHVKGKVMWEVMALALRTGGKKRSWHSLKERFIKQIIPNLKTYEVDQALIFQFQEPFDLDQRLPEENSKEDQLIQRYCSAIPFPRRAMKIVLHESRRSSQTNHTISWDPNDKVRELNSLNNISFFQKNPAEKPLPKLYSTEEDELIIKHIRKLKGSFGGNSLWKDLQALGVLKGRSWQSLRTRFLSYIFPNLDMLTDLDTENLFRKRMKGFKRVQKRIHSSEESSSDGKAKQDEPGPSEKPKRRLLYQGSNGGHFNTPLQRDGIKARSENFTECRAKLQVMDTSDPGPSTARQRTQLDLESDSSCLASPRREKDTTQRPPSKNSPRVEDSYKTKRRKSSHLKARPSRILTASTNFEAPLANTGDSFCCDLENSQNCEASPCTSECIAGTPLPLEVLTASDTLQSQRGDPVATTETSSNKTIENEDSDASTDPINRDSDSEMQSDNSVASPEPPGRSNSRGKTPGTKAKSLNVSRTQNCLVGPADSRVKKESRQGQPRKDTSRFSTDDRTLVWLSKPVSSSQSSSYRTEMIDLSKRIDTSKRILERNEDSQHEVISGDSGTERASPSAHEKDDDTFVDPLYKDFVDKKNRPYVVMDGVKLCLGSLNFPVVYAPVF